MSNSKNQYAFWLPNFQTNVTSLKNSMVRILIGDIWEILTNTSTVSSILLFENAKIYFR